MIDARSRLDDLASKIDAFVGRVDARYPGELACTPGCADCCRRRLTITSVEAARIEALLAAIAPSAREVIVERARSNAADACAALDEDGRCSIYAARPMVCRSHGVPIRFDADAAPPEGTRSLPMIDACFKNFIGRDLASIDASAIINQATLSTLVGTIDTAYALETGHPRGERLDLAALLAARSEQRS